MSLCIASSEGDTGRPEVPGPVPGGKLVRLPKNFFPFLEASGLPEVPGSLVVVSTAAAGSSEENMPLIDLKPDTMKVRQKVCVEKWHSPMVMFKREVADCFGSDHIYNIEVTQLRHQILKRPQFP